MTENNEKDDFNLDSVFEDDTDLDDFFKDDKEGKAIDDDLDKSTDEEFTIDDEHQIDPTGPDIKETTTTPRKKRTFLDFEPDMDAILMTAQSSMIIEGIKCYSKKTFNSKTLNIYIEALKGAEFYIKILNRNPDNYYKLKKLIDVDIDCQEVERTAFNLYKKVHGEPPGKDQQKSNAFGMLQRLFTEAVNKASISRSMITIKQYFLLSGGLDESKIKSCVDSDNIEFKAVINNLNQQVKISIDMLKKGKGEIAKGLKGKDVNIFVVKSSQLLSYYYKIIGNEQLVKYYMRINDLYKKYFVIRD